MKVTSTIALGIPLLASVTFPSNLTVVSQDGVPIPNVYIAGSKLSDFKATLHAWTDENGNAVVNGKEWEQATTVEAIKPGFYETVGSNPILDGPDHATIKLVAPIRPVSLKPIRYAERFCEHIPLTPTALDLVECNWVTLENGLHADVLVHGEIENFDNGDLEYRIIFEFPNSGDGMYLHDYSVDTGFFTPDGPNVVTAINQNSFTNRFALIERCGLIRDEYDTRIRIPPTNIVPLFPNGTMPRMENAARGCVFKIRTGLGETDSSAVYILLPELYTLGAARDEPNVKLTSPQLYLRSSKNWEDATVEGNWALQYLTSAERDYKSPPWGLPDKSSPNEESNTNAPAAPALHAESADGAKEPAP